MSLKHRVKNIEKRVRLSMPHFTIPLFPPYNLDNVLDMIESWQAHPKATGTIFLISMSCGTFGELEYNPDCLETLERELEDKQKEFEAAKKASYEDMLQREKEKLERTHATQKMRVE